MLRVLLLMMAIATMSAADKAAKAQKVDKNPKLSALKSGELLDLGETKVTTPQGEPEGRGRILTDYSGMAYDAKRHRMLLFGGGHASTNYDGIAIIDLKDLTWKEEYAPSPLSIMVPENYDGGHGYWKKGPGGPYPRPAARHTVDLVNIVNDELILLASVEGNGPGLGGGWTGADSTHWVGGGAAAHYDLTKKVWSFADAVEGWSWPGSAIDPKTGKILTLGSRGLHVYDPKTKTISVAIDAGNSYVLDESGARIQTGELAYNISLTYFPPEDCFYHMTGPLVFRLKFNRDNPGASTITKIPTTGAPPAARITQFAYDPVSQIIGGGPLAGSFFAFDPKKREWKSKPTPGLGLAWMALEFDPVDNVFIFVTEWNAGACHAYAFRW
jgi:hypothetical protein